MNPEEEKKETKAQENSTNTTVSESSDIGVPGKENKLSLPMAVVIAGVLIAGAVYFSLSPRHSSLEQPAEIGSALLKSIRPVSASDHIRGNPGAPVVIVEYSDTECPFCRVFHGTMLQVMEEYGSDGRVAWVYRHFPLGSIHSKAREEAEALECAGELGGEEKFWAYTDRLYEITPSNDGLDLAELPKIAEFVGLDVNEFSACLASGRHAGRVAGDLQNAAETGGRGTPWSIVIGRKGKMYPINGAQPYSAVREIIEEALR